MLTFRKPASSGRSPKSNRRESAPLPKTRYGSVSSVAAADVAVGEEISELSEAAVGSAVDAPSTEVALALVVDAADKSVVSDDDNGVNDPVEVGDKDDVTLISVPVLSASPPALELRLGLVCEAEASSAEGFSSHEVYTATYSTSSMFVYPSTVAEFGSPGPVYLC